MMKDAQVLSVSRLVFLLKELVEDNFVQVMVEGEISNFSTPTSGHFYFSLKDKNSQIRTVMFRQHNRLLRFRPENGMKVVCSGRVSVYAQRGDIQLIVDRMEPSGIGSLQLAFEQLKEKLTAEGLFADERKKPLPAFPQTIGIVTSATGAAIHDILNVLQRRSAALRIILCPVRVQGDGASQAIAEAIADLNRHGESDVIIAGRGGGSIEDLWAFNEEVVARAIAASDIPVISAVGHEVDFSIADFVADHRAPTPSAAAEIVVKNRLELESHVDHLIMRLQSQVKGHVRFLRERVEGLARRLRSPQQMVAQYRQQQKDLEARLQRAIAQQLQQKEFALQALGARLDALSPLKTLSRGYAIVFDEHKTKAIRSAAELRKGDKLAIRLSEGGAEATVDKVIK